MHKLTVILFIILAIAASPLYAILFLPGVGAKPSKDDRADYAKRAANFDGKNFHNESETTIMTKKDEEDPLTASKKDSKPKSPLPVASPAFLEQPTKDDFTVTWFGHSSLLIQFDGKNILIDPVLSKKLSPVSWIGVNRFTPCPVTVEDLPHIDILLISHDHYDHLDYKVMKKFRKLSDKVEKIIVPLGVECHLQKWGFDMAKVQNMAWWEEAEIGGLKIACTPAQHFSGRWISGGNRTLWASWVFSNGKRQFFYNGDSGFAPHYEKIHEKYGDFDFALMECGQYNLRWSKIHSFPEEGADAMKILGARLAMPIHWGAFVLAPHAWDDPIRRFVRHAEETALPVITPKIGETVDLTSGNLTAWQEKWWEGME